MDETASLTLGKRILYHRKRLGLTQDQLAERMGVTAQAVSKWEHDLSCPDVTTVPRLAELFGISTDELLGVARLRRSPGNPTWGKWWTRWFGMRKRADFIWTGKAAEFGLRCS